MFGEPGDVASASSASEGSRDGSGDEEHFGPDALPMRDELARIKEEFGDDTVVDQTYFQTFVLRGRWTEEHTGQWWDRLGARAKAGLPTEWCAKYMFTRQTTWARKAHTEIGCLLMSSEYCRKAHYFYALWLARVAEEQWAFEYTQGDLDEYRPSDEYLDWALEVPIGSETYKRFTELHLLMPRKKALGH